MIANEKVQMGCNNHEIRTRNVSEWYSEGQGRRGLNRHTFFIKNPHQFQ